MAFTVLDGHEGQAGAEGRALNSRGPSLQICRVDAGLRFLGVPQGLGPVRSQLAQGESPVLRCHHRLKTWPRTLWHTSRGGVGFLSFSPGIWEGCDCLHQWRTEAVMCGCVTVEAEL